MDFGNRHVDFGNRHVDFGNPRPNSPVHLLWVVVRSETQSKVDFQGVRTSYKGVGEITCEISSRTTCWKVTCGFPKSTLEIDTPTIHTTCTSLKIFLVIHIQDLNTLRNITTL